MKPNAVEEIVLSSLSGGSSLIEAAPECERGLEAQPAMPDRESDDESLRLFVAVAIPPDILEQAAVLMSRLKKGSVFSGAQLTWVRPEGIHATLAFLGRQPVERVAAIAKAMDIAAAATSPMRLMVAGLSLFPSERSPRVLCFNLKKDVELVGRLQERLAYYLKAERFDFDIRPFRPHLTIARIKGHSGLKALGDIIESHRRVKLGMFECDRITLFSSRLHPEGAVYTVLHEAVFPAAENGGVEGVGDANAGGASGADTQ